MITVSTSLQKYPWGYIFLYVTIALSILALLAGALMGALGGGGAILTVPVFTYLAGLEPSTATTASLIAVASSSLVGLIPHARASNVQFRTGTLFGALGIAGSALGSALTPALSPHVLMTAFAALLVGTAVQMLRSTKTTHSPGDRPKTTEGNCDHSGNEPATKGSGLAVHLATATGIGFLTGLFGVGGGFVIVPALTLILGMTMSVAIGTSLVVITVNSAISLGFRAFLPTTLDWGLVAPFAALMTIGALIGGRASTRLPQRPLKLAFAALLMSVAVLLGFQNIPALFS